MYNGGNPLLNIYDGVDHDGSSMFRVVTGPVFAINERLRQEEEFAVLAAGDDLTAKSRGT